MKKQFSALVLTLVLCLGLAIPVSAAGASDLTPAEAASYLKILSNAADAQYSGLEDLNGDGKPELITAGITVNKDSMSANLKVEVWTIRNGAAARTMSKSIAAYSGNAMNDVGIARQSGTVRILVSGSNPPMNSASYSFYDMNGKAETYEGNMDLAGTKEIDSLYEELSQSWKIVYLFHGEGGSWYAANENSSNFDVSDNLSTRAEAGSSASAGSSTYTVSGFEYDGSPFTATFQTVSVEKKAIIRGNENPETGEVDDFTKEWATLVSIRPGSYIKLSGGTLNFTIPDGGLGISAIPGTFDDPYFTVSSGVNEPVFIMDGPASDVFQSDYKVMAFRLNYAADADGNPVYICLGKEAAAAGGFTDVKSDAYYAGAVEWAVEQGITSGTTATTFSPNATCTRAQILTFLWRANGSPKVSGTNSFSDVSASDYYYQAALWAKSKGLVSGSAFGGSTPATRAATVTYLWKLAGSPSASAPGFTDVSADADYAKAVGWAVKEGITSGTSATAFSPNATCTRGQIVTFLYRDLAE